MNGDGPVFYDDELPVTQEWVEAHTGQEAQIRFVASLDDLIDAAGMDGMNDLCDAMTGVVLYDVTYRIAPWGDDDEPSDQSLLIEAHGTVAPLW